MADKIEKMIAETFLEMAAGTGETGGYGKRAEDRRLQDWELSTAKRMRWRRRSRPPEKVIDVYYIGTLEAAGEYNASIVGRD